MPHEHTTKSRFTELGFTSLKIKHDTKRRLTVAKAVLAAQEGQAVSHDDLLRRILDRYEVEIVRPAAPRSRVPA